MSTDEKPHLDEIRSFARRHGLEKLAPEHVARLAELAVYVGALGAGLPRPTRKEDGLPLQSDFPLN